MQDSRQHSDKGRQVLFELLALAAIVLFVAAFFRADWTGGWNAW